MIFCRRTKRTDQIRNRLLFENELSIFGETCRWIYDTMLINRTAKQEGCITGIEYRN